MTTEEDRKKKHSEACRRSHQKHWDKYNESTRRWQKENPERYKRNRRISTWKSKGMNTVIALQVWESATECEICRTLRKPGKGFGVDHDHQTGQIRGFLCDNCNLGIGKFFDRPDLLEKAAVYLKGELRGVEQPTKHGANSSAELARK